MTYTIIIMGVKKSFSELILFNIKCTSLYDWTIEQQLYREKKEH